MTNHSSHEPDWYSYGYDPPHDYWKSTAGDFVRTCKAKLWGPSQAAQSAQRTLKERGFSRDMLQKAWVGINPEGHYRDRSRWWGPVLPDNRMWIPRGFVLPWAGDGGPSRIYVRRPRSDVDREAEDRKKRMTDKYIADINYQHVPRKAPLFGLQWVDKTSPIVLVEQEFDALAIQDEAGDLCSAVATGDPKGARRTDWRQLLMDAPGVLVAFDVSEPGQEAAETWMDALPNSHRWPTYIGDRDMRMQPGEQLRNWVENGIDAMSGV